MDGSNPLELPDREPTGHLGQHPRQAERPSLRKHETSTGLDNNTSTIIGSQGTQSESPHNDCGCLHIKPGATVSSSFHWHTRSCLLQRGQVSIPIDFHSCSPVSTLADEVASDALTYWLGMGSSFHGPLSCRRRNLRVLESSLIHLHPPSDGPRQTLGRPNVWEY